MVFYDETLDMFGDLDWDYLFGQFVKKVYPDSDGNLWIDVLAFAGLIYFQTDNFFKMGGMFQENDFQILQPTSEGTIVPAKEPESISNAEINNFFVDAFDNIWIGTQLGLNQLVKKTQNFTSLN